MKTLYEILGITDTADHAQIEQAYRKRLDALQEKAREGNEECLLQMKAVKEAYQILSSASRRKSYDERLLRRSQPLPAVRRSGMPWAMPMLAVLLAVGSLLWHKVAEEETARLGLEIARANASVRSAELLAQAEKFRLDAEKFAAMRRAEERMLYEFELARLGLTERNGVPVHPD